MRKRATCLRERGKRGWARSQIIGPRENMVLQKPFNTLCLYSICLGIDEPLYEHYNKNLSQLVELASDHITQVNHIYSQVGMRHCALTPPIDGSKKRRLSKSFSLSSFFLSFRTFSSSMHFYLRHVL